MNEKGLKVDGVSIATTNNYINIQADTENTIDINELKRRIERRDAENKRKDREITILQKEILTLTKDIQELRDRNDQLQQSLSNARLLTAASRQDEENKLANSLIVDLQTRLTKSEYSLNQVMGDYEVEKATSSTLKEQLIEAMATSEVRLKEIQGLKEDIYSLNVKIKTLQIRIEEKDNEYEKIKTINETLLKSERQVKSQLEHEKTVTYEQERTINELLATNKRIMASNIIKSETNQFLSSELHEITNENVVLTASEMEVFREIESKNNTLLERNKELTKSIELHMDLLHRCEEENNVLKLKLNDEINLREELQHEMRERKDGQNNSENILEQLKKEVVKLRKENKLLSEKCDEYLKNIKNQRKSPQLQHIPPSQQYDQHNGNININQQSIISNISNSDRKKLKLAEETVRALRNRLSFLLEQLNHLSKQSTKWSEQKLILKSQISSLLEANISLRERLLSVQRSFMERSLYELDHPAVRRNAQPIFLTENNINNHDDDNNNINYVNGNNGNNNNEYETPHHVMESAIVTNSLVPLPKSGEISNDAKVREARMLEYSMRSELAQPLPYTVEGYVERMLFDTLCAFTSGIRQSNNENEGKGNKQQPMRPKVERNYLTSVGTDGLYVINLEPGQYTHITTQMDMSIRAEAEELLTGLQIPAFLKFVQTRPPEKFASLFTEKIATILNFLRSTTNDYINQLGETRIANAKLQSKISHADLQVQFMKKQYSTERLSKQKNIMKYIREQLQLSDYKKLIYDISQLGRDSLDEIDVQRKDLVDQLKRENPSYFQLSNPTNVERYYGLESQKLRGLMGQLKSVAEQLATTALHNFGEDISQREEIVGKLDIKLYDSQLDDETCHGVIGLLSGALNQSNESNDNNNDNNNNNDNDIVEDEMNEIETQNLSRSDKIMAQGLGIHNSGDMLSTATMLKKSFLKIQSNYIDRILLLNFKDNSLTDISCKILSGVVEKSTSLRMLDIRGNMISSNGAKMLFDATRRNPTVLYVTQKQNGLMIEGHREIIGSTSEKKSRSEPMSKSGIISTRANDTRERDNPEDDSNYNEIMEFAANQQAALLKKHPLRIDIRDNNPEQIVAEKLLEATEFMIPSNGKSIKNISNSMEDEEVNSMIISDQRGNRTLNGSGEVYQERPNSSRLSSGNFNQVVNNPSRQRPHSASNFTGFNRPPKSQNPIVIRPSSSAGLTRKVGISGEGIRHNIRSEKKNFLKRDDDSDIDNGDDDDILITDDNDDIDGNNETNQYIKSRLIEKRNERLEGTKGAGVGSLLDTEIRKMQMQSSDPRALLISNHQNGQLNRSTSKKIKRKIISKKPNRPLTMEEKKKEMKGVYVTPVIQHTTVSNRQIINHNNNNNNNNNNNIVQPVIKSISRSASNEQKSSNNPKGYVEKKRVLITSQYDSQQQRLGLSKSTPNIRPVSGGGTSNPISISGIKQQDNNSNFSKTTGNINPYTQRTLNPGILF